MRLLRFLSIRRALQPKHPALNRCLGKCSRTGLSRKSLPPDPLPPTELPIPESSQCFRALRRPPTLLRHPHRRTEADMKTANLLLALEDDVLRRDVMYRLENSERPCSFDEQSPNDWRGLLNFVSQHRPEILLIELSAIKADLANSLRAIKKSAPQTKIVALHSSDDPKTILTAMRAGANEFIHPPFDETFALAIERVIDSNAEEQRPERRGKVVGFLSAKGGCGATTLACHIAAG